MPDEQQHNPRAETRARLDWRRAAIYLVLVALGLFLLALILTGQVWRAVAYSVVALFAFLFLLAGYFWGAMFFGGTLEMFVRRRSPVPWDITGGALDVPEHDIDPGLELLAAGMLVYRVGEVKPQPYFRKVPLANVRAVRPFMVARTGVARDHQFVLTLSDEVDARRFQDVFIFSLEDAPQVVMPPYSLVIEHPRALVGQRWTLQVRSGVTVVTSFRFLFVDGTIQAADIAARSGAGAQPYDGAADEDGDHGALSALIDEAVKRDALTAPREIVLEVR